MRTLVMSTFVVLCLSTTAHRALAGGGTLQLQLAGRRVDGTPVHWTNDRLRLLGRDGRLWDFALNEASNYHKASSRFRAHSFPEMDGQLRREFGRRFGVTGTGPFLVVHLRGQEKKWGKRFQELHWSMVHYLRRHGFEPETPCFPLVAVVLPSRQEFLSYAARGGTPIGEGVTGYYHRFTNRMVLYDVNWGWFGSAQATSAVTAVTIIHEAAHQTAFNTNVHNRFAEIPVWLIEGIGTLFEARGVWNFRYHPKLRDRVNHARLRDYQQRFTGGRHRGWLRSVVVNDGLFLKDPVAAYAYAWAVTFYLSENEPDKLAQYAKLTASLPGFEKYSASERLDDFTSVFGENLIPLEERVHRLIMTRNAGSGARGSNGPSNRPTRTGIRIWKGATAGTRPSRRGFGPRGTSIGTRTLSN